MLVDSYAEIFIEGKTQQNICTFFAFSTPAFASLEDKRIYLVDILFFNQTACVENINARADLTVVASKTVVTQ